MFSLLRPIPVPGRRHGENNDGIWCRGAAENARNLRRRVEQVLRFPGVDRCSLVTVNREEEEEEEEEEER